MPKLYSLILFFAVTFIIPESWAQDTFVRGYIRSDGTSVQPHYRTEGNETQYDNYSTKGNTNPYTGKPGHIIPDDNNSDYKPKRSQYNGQYDGGFGQGNNRKKKEGSLFDND